VPPEATGPNVSLCVPLYRSDPQHLARLVASFAEQRYRDLEVVMVDDATPASTRARSRR